MVTKPQNVFVMRDIACHAYVAGSNACWFAGNAEDGFQLPDIGNQTANAHAEALAQNVRENLMARLSYQDDVTAKYASLMAFPMGPSQFNKLDTVMSLSPRLLPWEVTGPGSTHTSFPGGETMFNIYKGSTGVGFNLKSIHFGEDMKATEKMKILGARWKSLGEEERARWNATSI